MMSEPRAPYIAKVVFTDDMQAEALRLFEAAGIAGGKDGCKDRYLLALAQACVEAQENGFGAVMARWVNGQPLRLRVMKSKTWR